MGPKAAQDKLEPDQEPLFIRVTIQHLDISDVPSSGGSFGVDVGISLKWDDKRYIEGNEGRITDCKSNHVVWTEANQFWLPNFYVWNARELDGYLNEQDRAGTAGNRYLYYDTVYGVFELFTMSH